MKPFQPNIIFVRKAGAYPKGAPESKLMALLKKDEKVLAYLASLSLTAEQNKLDRLSQSPF